MSNAAPAPERFSKHANRLVGDPTESGLVSAVSKLLVLYAIYVFISGWAFLDYYFRYYGVDPRWLDLSIYDILIKGFTILFTGGWLLWPIYLILIPAPLIAERKLKNQICSVLTITVVLLSILLMVYTISRRAGEERARLDKGNESTLPAITFTYKASKLQYHGRVLAFRTGTYFVHGVELIPGQDRKAINPFEGSALELSLLRAEDITDVTIIEHR
jgi:hypothetical protein